MSIPTDLVAWLLHEPTVAAITTRIHPAPLPQSCILPAITYQRISGGPMVAHDGATGLSRPRYQLDCWAADYAGADALASAVYTALSARNWGNLSFIDNDMDLPDPVTGNSRRVIDVLIWHRE